MPHHYAMLPYLPNITICLWELSDPIFGVEHDPYIHCAQLGITLYV